MLNEKTNVQRTTCLPRTLWHCYTTSGGFPTYYQDHKSVYWACEDEWITYSDLFGILNNAGTQRKKR